ncbi:RrF2 family transcriptional regulator [Sphingomonas faeni]|uniref:RrF2 family transcriptional regulator n=1 Tax=Sphingomonas faeni TaxID=185950 RepID=UPI003361AD97
MSHISTAVEYALHTLLYIIDLPDEAAAPSSKDLATLRALPVKFMAGVMTKLNKAGIVVATEGVRGGVRLARRPEEISFFDVVIAVDGRKALFDCRNVRHACPLYGPAPPAWATSGVCGIHAVMLEADARMKDVLKARTLRDMADHAATRIPGEFRAETRIWLEDRSQKRLQRSRPPKAIAESAETTETLTCPK